MLKRNLLISIGVFLIVIVFIVFNKNHDNLISKIDSNSLVASLIMAKEEWDVRNISYSPLPENSIVSEWQQCTKDPMTTYSQYPKLIARNTKLANLLVKRKISVEKAGNVQENINLIDSFIDLIGKTLESGKNVNSLDGLSGALMLPFPIPQNIKLEGAVLDSKCVYEKENGKIINNLITRVGQYNPSFDSSQKLSVCSSSGTSNGLDDLLSTLLSVFEKGTGEKAKILFDVNFTSKYNNFLLIDTSTFPTNHPWIRNAPSCGISLNIVKTPNGTCDDKKLIPVDVTTSKGGKDKTVRICMDEKEMIKNLRSNIEKQYTKLKRIKASYEKERDGFNKQIENIDKQIDAIIAVPIDSIPAIIPSTS